VASLTCINVFTSTKGRLLIYLLPQEQVFPDRIDGFLVPNRLATVLPAASAVSLFPRLPCFVSLFFIWLVFLLKERSTFVFVPQWLVDFCNFFKSRVFV
jgi:hypothetical protein